MSQPKQNVGVRLPVPWIEKLKALSEQTGLTPTELLTEAIGNYLGEDVSGVGDRLQKLEREVNELKRKLLNLATL
jgi:predicted DNA-binding protein